jgi:DegV family protein with EDD domain
VTDSTADIPHDVAASLGIVVVPLTVAFGGDSFRDGIDLTPQEFLRRLAAASELPKTSQPPVTAFESAFRSAIERGRDVVCVTISADLSGTHNAARLAADAVDPSRITVIDSRTTTMQQGLIVLEAARAAGTGASGVAEGVRAAIPRSGLHAVLQTLDYVYRGGRIGRAQQLVGSAFAIKPVLGFVDGVLVPIERVRTWKRALNRAIELAAEPGDVAEIAILHSDNLADAEATAEELGRRCPGAEITITHAGATIMTYAGPGAIGIASLTAT